MTGEPASKKDKKFLQMAMGVAALSESRFKHGALVVRHSHILGASPNIPKNNPRYCPVESCSIHAERAALRKAGYPQRAIIYVARINSKGERRLSKPCESCAKLIEELKCKVVWTESE